MNWPFSGMKVGDVVTIEDDIPRAQSYAHVYGKQSGKRFSTSTSTGVLMVERLPDGSGSGRVVSRERHPIWTMAVGELSVFEKGDYGLTSPNLVAYRVAQRTGRKFRCRRVAGDRGAWYVERIA